MNGTPSMPVTVDVGGVELAADLTLPRDAAGVVIFVHGSGSSRFSRRNRGVANSLNAGGLGTLLADLLAPGEEAFDARTAALRFNIPMLAQRTACMIDFVRSDPRTSRLPVGLFGASTGAAAAIVAATSRAQSVRAIVSRGGRIDLAGDALEALQTPLLAIVGGDDCPVIALHEEALPRIRAPLKYEVIAGATHLFEQPGALEKVSAAARSWFCSHLPTRQGVLTMYPREDELPETIIETVQEEKDLRRPFDSDQIHGELTDRIDRCSLSLP